MGGKQAKHCEAQREDLERNPDERTTIFTQHNESQSVLVDEKGDLSLNNFMPHGSPDDSHTVSRMAVENEQMPQNVNLEDRQSLREEKGPMTSTTNLRNENQSHRKAKLGLKQRDKNGDMKRSPCVAVQAGLTAATHSTRVPLKENLYLRYTMKNSKRCSNRGATFAEESSPKPQILGKTLPKVVEEGKKNHDRRLDMFITKRDRNSGVTQNVRTQTSELVRQDTQDANILTATTPSCTDANSNTNVHKQVEQTLTVGMPAAKLGESKHFMDTSSANTSQKNVRTSETSGDRVTKGKFIRNGTRTPNLDNATENGDVNHVTYLEMDRTGVSSVRGASCRGKSNIGKVRGCKMPHEEFEQTERHIIPDNKQKSKSKLKKTHDLKEQAAITNEAIEENRPQQGNVSTCKAPLTDGGGVLERTVHKTAISSRKTATTRDNKNVQSNSNAPAQTDTNDRLRHQGKCSPTGKAAVLKIVTEQLEEEQDPASQVLTESSVSKQPDPAVVKETIDKEKTRNEFKTLLVEGKEGGTADQAVPHPVHHITVSQVKPQSALPCHQSTKIKPIEVIQKKAKQSKFHNKEERNKLDRNFKDGCVSNESSSVVASGGPGNERGRDQAVQMTDIAIRHDSKAYPVGNKNVNKSKQVVQQEETVPNVAPSTEARTKRKRRGKGARALAEILAGNLAREEERRKAARENQTVKGDQRDKESKIRHGGVPGCVDGNTVRDHVGDGSKLQNRIKKGTRPISTNVKREEAIDPEKEQRRKILKAKRVPPLAKAQPTLMDLLFCQSCGDTKQPNGQNLFHCPKCKAAYYCTRACQHKDSKMHKKVCTGQKRVFCKHI